MSTPESISWLKDAVERRAVWPYELSPDVVKAQFSGFLLRKGKRIGEPFQDQNWKLSKKKITDAQLRWDLTLSGPEWDQIELQLGLSIENPSQFFSVPCIYAAEVLCKGTRWRSAVSKLFSTGTVFLSMKILRKDIVGYAIVTPSVLLSENVTHSSDPKPSMKGSRLAVGFPLHIQIDTPQESPGAGIEILWHRFQDEIGDSMYQLIIEPPHPILRLNNRHPSLKLIFESRTKIGFAARIRNALFSMIASDVWLQLAEYASSIEKMDLDDPDDPTVVLSRKIIRTLSRMIKRPADEIIASFDDHTLRSLLTLRIQHHLKTLSHQNALLQAFVSQDQASEFYE
ncbi:hypothetical protein L0244_20950 [bacterium]|nr:hypothetical protein [bacterium]